VSAAAVNPGRPTAASPTGAADLADATPSGALDPRRWKALVVLCLALVVVSMDALIVNVALPTIGAALGAGTGQLQWVVDAYTIAFAGAVLSAGSLGDRFGRRRALGAGLVVVVVGSLVGAVATTPGVLITGRAIMGLGGALVCPATLSIVTHTFPRSERGKALAVWSSFSALGIIVGPPIGGLLVERFWWGSVFLINVPLALVLLVLAWRLVPESRDSRRTPLDVPGAIVSAAALVALVYAIIEVPGRGWADARTVTAFGTAALLLGAFVGRQRRAAHPLLPVGLFRNPRFSAANASLALSFLAMAGTLFVLTQMLQGVLQFSPLRAGVAMLPAASLVLTAPFAAPLVRRVGTTAVVSGGLAVQAVGILVAATGTGVLGYPRIAAALTLFGLGMGLAMPAATESIMNSLPIDRAGVGSALNDTTRNVGGALGVAVIGSVLSAVYRSNVAPDLSSLPGPLHDAAQGSLGGALGVAGAIGRDGGALASAARDAFVAGSSASLAVAAGVLGLGAVLAGALLPSRDKHPGGEPGGTLERGETSSLPHPGTDSPFPTGKRAVSGRGLPRARPPRGPEPSHD